MEYKDSKKELIINVDGTDYERIPVKTHVVKYGDDIIEVVKKYTDGLLKSGDMVFISEKCVACTQNRAIPLNEIHPSKLAAFLSHFVTKTPHGIGLGMPETMHYAIKECGTVRILVAAAAGAIGKLLGQKGWFYIVAGRKAASIDGPTPNTIPPYNQYVVLGPKDPDKVALSISKAINYPVFIVDINDLGGNILGSSNPEISNDLLVRILKDNPLGQCSESTPIGIIRKR
ncbi:MAG: coenzyme F420-0:L-glutamate ligase [Erysipelotrichaceae bacterium]